ncbi:MAG: bifunctional hydroxymethylpyrimidine kinase/phosphomethylpyrimidine kinase [Desulfobacteraceae bacterium]|nr:bifunctional hydroxymethylpyrimidine kinase/phosphomethylpyrimidine kinase [Desulfobacteraceae bacterium]
MAANERKGIVLSIAGSDPSGGAGIQADLKTMAVLGVYGAAAVTCLTVQNTSEVAALVPVAPELVREQIRLVLADLPVTHVKIGMIGTAAVARAVGAALDGFAGEVVYDPVLRATAGADLMEPAALAAVRAEVISRATVLTPNLAELHALTSASGDRPGELRAAGRQLLADFPRLRAVAIKGGHGPVHHGSVTDYLVRRSPDPASPSCLEATHPWVDTRNSHGTGCTFASAFAAFHLLTGSDDEAFTRAAAFVHRLLAASAGSRLGGGTGPLLHHLLREER